MPFNDPRVVEAIEEFGWFAATTPTSPAAPARSATTDFRDSPKGLFSSPPQCYMHRQASFIPSFFPEGTESASTPTSSTSRPMPSKDLGNPVLGAGTLMAFITKDSPAAHAPSSKFLQTPIAHEVWMAQSGFLTPHKGVNPTPLRQRRAEAAGRDPAERHDLPLRRLGPDAGRVGAGHVLDRHGRLHRRQGRAGSGRRDPVLGRAEVSLSDKADGAGCRGRATNRRGPPDVTLTGFQGRGRDESGFTGPLTIVIGVGGCVGYFYFSNQFLDKVLYPARGPNAGRNINRANMIRPWLFLFPAIFALGLYLAYPVFETLRLSLTDRNRAASWSSSGFANYRR
jgi:hypothetical protein